MATVRFYTAVDMRFFDNSGTIFHDSITGGTLTSSSTTMYRIDEGDLGRDSFYGSGLGMTSQNMPTAGTVNEWAYEYSSGPGTFELAWDFYDFSLAASTFSSLLLADDVGALLADHIMAGNDWVYGSTGSDWLLGYGGNDTMLGDEGDDAIDGGAGIDDMVGGNGDDTYYVDNDGDMVSEEADEGNDTVMVRVVPTLGFYVLGDNVENLRNVSGASLYVGGNALGNQMIGTNAAADFLYGGAGDDYLNGGTGGGDAMYGGAGDDVFVVDHAGDFVTDRSDDAPGRGSGVDEVRSSISFALTGTDRSDIENLRLTGTAAINATGNSLANELTGNSAANILNGGGGADVMRGGAGNDIYYVDNGGDRTIETSAADGIDTVRSSATLVLGNHLENLQLTGTDAINGTGNALANRISGNNEANLIFGRDGDDIINGNGGNDGIYGGAGLDEIIGGAGEDWIEGGAGRDLMSGGADADMFVFRAGDFGGVSTGTCDRIRDFSGSQGDQIRLNSIDANSANGSSSNEAFSFIGNSTFHGVAGELRYAQSNGNTYVYGDMNGDRVADFMIRLDGLHTLSGSDFLL